ncbi:atp3 gamma subunit of the F1 sector of mitochondrial F1F0 ATP synthase [Phlyctochytrium bullatum]|nr:atp3 gamma subunit of the F1 sector of mitochondrial F1F0 ATP synthase [Phlyctochytrium bullatum]
MFVSTAASMIRPTAGVAISVPSPLLSQARTYATLKEIQMRLKSVSNIAKITKSMKMIASTKVNKAQRNMETARVYGSAGTGQALFKHAETPDADLSKPLVVAVSSDRGLCGGIHSMISKNVKRYVAEVPQSSIVVLGQKARNQIQRDYRKSIAITFDQVAKNVPTWFESAIIADQIIASGIEADGAKIFYNQFKSVIAYETTSVVVPSVEVIAASPKIASYEVDDELLKNFQEFTLANSLFWAIAEGYASEMAAKRTAMENATKNAGEMITKLTLTYNRSRQATITNELALGSAARGQTLGVKLGYDDQVEGATKVADFVLQTNLLDSHHVVQLVDLFAVVLELHVLAIVRLEICLGENQINRIENLFFGGRPPALQPATSLRLRMSGNPPRYGRRADSLANYSTSKANHGVVTGRATTLPARISDQDSNPHEIVVDTLWENQRGCYIYAGEPSFSAEALMPTDSPPWCDPNGRPQVDRMLYPAPPNWEWVTDWTLDLNGDVDADGWSYSHHFNSKAWSGICSLTHYVRRRAWSRTRRRTGFDASEEASDTQNKILQLPSLLRQCALDRQRLEALDAALLESNAVSIKTYTAMAILNEFQFDKYRLQAAQALKDRISKDDLPAVLKTFKFHSVKEVLKNNNMPSERRVLEELEAILKAQATSQKSDEIEGSAFETLKHHRAKLDAKNLTSGELNSTTLSQVEEVLKLASHVRDASKTVLDSIDDDLAKAKELSARLQELQESK